MELAALLNQTADQLPTGYDKVSFKLKNDALFLEVSLFYKQVNWFEIRLLWYH